MKRKAMVLAAAVACTAGCMMTVDTFTVTETPERDFRIEARMTRDASYMWDGSQDTREVWAVNRSPSTYCAFSVDSESGYRQTWTVPAGSTQRLLSSSRRAGSWGATPGNC